MPDISVMLTCYKRPKLMTDQIHALKDQSIPYKDLTIWCNDKLDPDDAWHLERSRGDSIIECDKNWGVWPRFTFARHLEGEHIAVFDDDTIPGPKWFENCLRTMEVVGPALLGSVGVLFPNGTRRERQYAGWKRPMNEAAMVDIVGHAWFFPKPLLQVFCGGYIPSGCLTYGEDYALAFAAQKMGWKTYCPPHPEDDKDLWGSLNGKELGSDEHALWKQEGEEEKKVIWHDEQVSQGWRPEAMA